MKDENVGSVPEKVLRSGKTMTINKGEQKEIPPYMGIGAEIRVMVSGDRLIVDAYEPGYSAGWAGRIERITDLEAANARLRAAARKAHDAMMNWHFAHGNPSALMSPEEAEMGEACKTIAALLDEGDDDR